MGGSVGKPHRERGPVPASALASFVLQLIEVATLDDASQGRVLKLFRFFRATWLALAAVSIIRAVIFGAAVAGAATLLGLHPYVAIGVGTAGSAVMLVRDAIRAGRCALALLRALADLDQCDHLFTGPSESADHDQSAA